MDRDVVLRMLLENGNFVVRHVQKDTDKPLSITLSR